MSPDRSNRNFWAHTRTFTKINCGGSCGWRYLNQPYVGDKFSDRISFIVTQHYASC